MTTLSRFPKGLWYETKRRRYRVRRYHNKVVYGPYYYRTLDQALFKLKEVNAMLEEIPKIRRGSTSPTKEQHEVQIS